jgi:hypothetical protein
MNQNFAATILGGTPDRAAAVFGDEQRVILCSGDTDACDVPFRRWPWNIGNVKATCGSRRN